MRTVPRTGVLLSVGLAVLLGIAGGAIAQDSTEDRLRALEERLQQQDEEIQRLKEELAGQQEFDDSISAEMDSYLGEIEDASWWQEPNTFRVYWDKSLVFATGDGNFKLKIGGRAMYDMAWFDYDGDLAKYLGTDSSDHYKAEFRRVRLYMSGTLYKNVFYKVQLDFAGTKTKDLDGTTVSTTDKPSFKDVFLGVKGIPLLGHIRVGHQFEPFGLETLTSSKYITFMERAMLSRLTPARNAGIMAYNAVLDKRVFWAFGVFNEGSAQSVLTQGHAFTGRIAGLPYYENKGEQLIHLGVAYSYRNRHARRDGDFSVRPEAHLSEKLLNLSPKLSSSNFESQSLFGLEFLVIWGSLSLQAEYVVQSIESDDNSSPDLDDPSQSGFYVFASYFVTGEHRKYKNGSLSRVSPLANFDGEGGWGAIELAIRYSMMDYEDGYYFDKPSKDSPEGQLSTVTFGINWYLNPNMRVMVNYIFADLEGVDGVSIFQIRWQIDF